VTRHRVRPVPTTELEALTPARLKNYRKALLALEESPALSDLSADDVARLEPGFIYFKSDPGWGPLHVAVVGLLQRRNGAR